MHYYIEPIYLSKSPEKGNKMAFSILSRNTYLRPAERLRCIKLLTNGQMPEKGHIYCEPFSFNQETYFYTEYLKVRKEKLYHNYFSLFCHYKQFVLFIIKHGRKGERNKTRRPLIPSVSGPCSTQYPLSLFSLGLFPPWTGTGCVLYAWENRARAQS